MYQSEFTVITNDDLLYNCDKIVWHVMKKVNRWFCKNLWNHASCHDRISTYLSRFFSHFENWTSCVHTENKKLTRTNIETQNLNVALTTFFNLCLLGGILSQIKPWKLIANFHPFTLYIACLYRIIYASDHHNHPKLTWNQSLFHKICRSSQYQYLHGWFWWC